MPIGFLFWLLMVLWFFFGLWGNWPSNPQDGRAWAPVGGNVLLFILLFILGWALFGFVVQGPGVH